MATKSQIPKIAEAFVEFQDEFVSLPAADGQWVIHNTKEAIALFVQSIINRTGVVQAVTTLLSAVISIIVVPATNKKFVAKDKFVVDTTQGAKVKISFLDKNFHKWFGNKVEEASSGNVVYGRKLNKASVDGQILQELGGKEKAKTTLTEVYAMMERQANGEKGELANDGSANIFYVSEDDSKLETLHAVDINWRGGGWDVRAVSIKSPIKWGSDCRIFSRNSLAA